MTWLIKEHSSKEFMPHPLHTHTTVWERPKSTGIMHFFLSDFNGQTVFRIIKRGNGFTTFSLKDVG